MRKERFDPEVFKPLQFAEKRHGFLRQYAEPAHAGVQLYMYGKDDPAPSGGLVKGPCRGHVKDNRRQIVLDNVRRLVREYAPEDGYGAGYPRIPELFSFFRYCHAEKGAPERFKSPGDFYRAVAVGVGLYNCHHAGCGCCAPPKLKIIMFKRL